MNLRILKKLSKRAAPMLIDLGWRAGDKCVSEGDGDSSHGGHDHKHMGRYPARHPDFESSTRYLTTRHGKYHIALYRPHCTWPGTVHFGGMSGYYEPEWEENDAYSLLLDAVFWHFAREVESTFADPVTGDSVEHCDFLPGRKMTNPSDIFRAATEMIAEKQQEAA